MAIIKGKMVDGISQFNTLDTKSIDGSEMKARGNYRLFSHGRPVQVDQEVFDAYNNGEDMEKFAINKKAKSTDKPEDKKGKKK